MMFDIGVDLQVITSGRCRPVRCADLRELVGQRDQVGQRGLRVLAWRAGSAS